MKKVQFDKKRQIIAALMLGAAGTGLPGLAKAEQQATDETAAPKSQDEIVVTASKRGTTYIQDIPYNISAVGEDLLEKTGATSLEDVTRLVPGVTSSGTPGNQVVVIRGLAADTGAAQVGIYLDEIPLSGIGGTNVRQSDLGLYDIERIEVLRGPQGTLYGAGSQGGTLRYITSKPDDSKFAAAIGARLASTTGGGERFDFDTMLNLPVVKDAVAVRAVAYARHADGFVDLPNLGIKEADDLDVRGGRLQAQFKLGENTKLLASAHYQRTKSDNPNQGLVGSDVNPTQVQSPFVDDVKLYNVTLEQGLGFGTLTATASKYTRKTFFAFDVSQFVPGSGRVDQAGKTDAFTTELRFASDFSGPFQTIIGVFYEKKDVRSSSDGSFIDTANGQPFVPARPFFSQESEQYTRNQAAFANATLDVTDRLQLEAGIRFFKMKRRDQGRLKIDPFGRPPGENPTQRAQSDGNVKKLQASYKFSDDILAYANFSEGFREGGPNAPALLGNYPLSYGPDFVKSFEAGLKTQLFDRRLTLNAATYLMKWDDIQVAQTDPTGAFGFSVNAGKAKLVGFELEGVARPKALPGFRANFAVRISEQKLTEDNPLAAGPRGDPNAGRDGDRIPGTSGFSANFGLEQTFPIAGLNGYVRGDMSYFGSARTTFNPADPLSRKFGDYTLVDLRAGIQEDSWEASFYGRNIFNVRKPTGWNVQNGLPDLISRTQPREIGLMFRYRY